MTRIPDDYDKVVDFRAIKLDAVKDVAKKEYELSELIIVELLQNPAAVKDWTPENVLITLLKAVVSCAALNKVSGRSLVKFLCYDLGAFADANKNNTKYLPNDFLAWFIKDIPRKWRRLIHPH